MDIVAFTNFFQGIPEHRTVSEGLERDRTPPKKPTGPKGLGVDTALWEPGSTLSPEWTHGPHMEVTPFGQGKLGRNYRNSRERTTGALKVPDPGPKKILGTTHKAGVPQNLRKGFPPFKALTHHSTSLQGEELFAAAKALWGTEANTGGLSGNPAVSGKPPP